MRGDSVIIDGRQRLTIRVVMPEGKVTVPKTLASYAEFQKFWEGMETRFQAPHLHWGPDDIRLATFLLGRHGLDKLAEWAIEFWSRHSAPLYKDYRHPMRLFAHHLPEIKAELE